ncbi:MAG: IS30 family transposase [Burkholderiales bacterium]|nr:IS30 family transposase [Burkholderiales bacterium]
MTYRQITSGQRYMLAALRKQGLRNSAIAVALGCHRSTVGRELKRNGSVSDGHYRADKAQERANGRRSRSRRNQQFTPEDFAQVDALLARRWSPEQIAGRLALELGFSISHETIYRHVWRDKRSGGFLYTHLRCARKRRRKGYGHYDSRGRLAGKRHISQRPPSVEARQHFGHWEIDTMMGRGSKDCILSLVERKTGLVIIGKLPNRTTASVNARVLRIVTPKPEMFETITADNGTEFHDYAAIEQRTRTTFYFATPYHSWERGTNENTNGLIRQYLPKGASMAKLTQRQCNDIAYCLNSRPRKRLGYKTPLECQHGC